MENHWIEDWLSARAESESTYNSYLRSIRIFAGFCQKQGKDFSHVVESWRAAHYSGAREEQMFLDQWHDIIRSYHTKLKSKYAPLSIKNCLSVPKSFFSFYKIPLDVELPRHTYVLWHNRDLTKPIIRQILNKSKQRNRTIFLMEAESGIRADTLIHLKYWQIKDDFEKGTVPMRILTPAESLKDHVGDRWSFIGEDGEKALREYLESRLPLKDQDYVFTTENPDKMKGEQFTVASISTIFRKTVRKLKLETGARPGKPSHYRMHGLRKYFRNNMKADPAFREFWMGHSLGVDAHYVSRDPEFHRKEYKKGYEQLRILEPATSAQLKDIKKQLRQKDVEIQGLNEQIEEMKKDNEIFKQIVDILRDPEKLRQFEKLIGESS